MAKSLPFSISGSRLVEPVLGTELVLGDEATGPFESFEVGGHIIPGGANIPALFVTPGTTIKAALEAIASALDAGSGVVTPKTAAYPIVAADNYNTFTNEGAAGDPALRQLTLPSAVKDLTFRFYCQDASGLQIKAAAGDTIRVGGSVSAVAGTMTLNDVGTWITLTAINATEWIGHDSLGLVDVV
jgi:hypothetical protein